MSDQIEEIVRFVRDHQPRWKWVGKSDFSEGSYDKSYYNRRDELLKGSQEFHDEETLWWTEQVRRYLDDKETPPTLPR